MAANEELFKRNLVYKWLFKYILSFISINIKIVPKRV